MSRKYWDRKKFEPSSNRHEEEHDDRDPERFIANFDVFLQTVTTGSADLIGTVL